MDYTNVLTSLLRMYRRQMDSDREVARFYAKCRDGTATYTDVYALADKAGIKMSGLLKKQILETFPNGVPPEAVDAILPPMLREQCETVLVGADRVQTIANTKAGVRLKPVDMVPDEERILGLTEHFKESGFTDEAAGLITNLSRSAVDESIRANAEFQNDSGMKVTVTRTYDDVGLNDGKTPCQWCLDRCGEDVPYSEAFSRGMFERHEGCGCIIDIKSAKGSKRQTDWTRNKWEDSPEVLNRRKTIGL